MNNEDTYQCVNCKTVISSNNVELEKITCCKKPNLKYAGEKIKPTKKIFQSTIKVFKKYLDTSELNYILLTAWTLGTYFHSQFETFPLLILNARKQSGKSRTLKLISSLASGSDGSISTSITETFLFRRKGGAVFFDEMESISSKEKNALKETINAVYKKGNKIIRYKEAKGEDGKEYVEEAFYPYYPLGLANIRGYGDVLEDRALQIILQRSNKAQTQLIEDFSTNEEILSLKNTLSRMKAEIPSGIFSEWNKFVEGKEYNPELKEIFESIKSTNLYGRPLEIFLPLFLIGDIFGVLPEIISTSKEYMALREGEFVDNIDDLLNDFIEKSQYQGFVNQSQILSDFKASLEEPEDWMNSKWFGRALKRLGVIQRKRLVNGRVQVELNNNSTNTTNTINPIKSTNTTNNQVELVEKVELKGLVDKGNTLPNQPKSPDLNPSKVTEPSQTSGDGSPNLCAKCKAENPVFFSGKYWFCKDCVYSGRDNEV